MATERLRRIVVRRDERAAVLVEAAIVTPIVILLFLSVAWGGLLFRSNLTTEHAAKVGARAASVAASSVDADYQILQAVRSNTSALGSGQVRKVVVYRASNFDEPPPNVCLSGGLGGSCNYYTAADMSAPAGQFGGAGKLDANYVPASRATSRSAPKYIGVYVETSSGVPDLGLPTPATLSNYQVLKIEASSY